MNSLLQCNMNKLIWVGTWNRKDYYMYEINFRKTRLKPAMLSFLHHLQHKDIILTLSGCVHSLAILTSFLRCQLKFDYQITIIIIVTWLVRKRWLSQTNGIAYKTGSSCDFLLIKYDLPPCLTRRHAVLKCIHRYWLIKIRRILTRKLKLLFSNIQLWSKWYLKASLQFWFCSVNDFLVLSVL